MDNNTNKKKIISLEDSKGKKTAKNPIDKKRKSETRDIQLMNFYSKNSSKIIKYSLITVSILFFIFLIFILLPQNTIKGVNSKTYLEQNKNYVEIDAVFTVVDIPDNYSLEQTVLYTAEVIKQIDTRKNQFIYNATFNYLLSRCSKPINKKNKILFDSLLKKMQSDEVFKELNANNRIKHTNLILCKKENNISLIKEDSKLERLEKRKLIVEQRLQEINDSIEFNKEAYGEQYDEKTGQTRYKNKSFESLKEDSKNQELLRKLTYEKTRVDNEIKHIKNRKNND